MTFLNLILLGGVAAAAIPVAIHLWHRRRIVPVEWGAMRFLVEMIRQNRRRLFLDQWLLMAVRMLLVLALALALMRPAITPETAVADGQAILRDGRVAAIVLFDDSASTGAGRTRTALSAMKDLALAYLDTLEKGDEVSLIRLSALGEPRAAPMFDLAAVREQVQAITATGLGSDVLALLEEGLVQASRHVNPAVELVLVTDGGAEGWRLDERARWGAVQRPFRDGAAPGGRLRRPRLLILQPPRPAAWGNVGVTDLQLDRALLPAGLPVTLRAAIRHRGHGVGNSLAIRLRVDGRTVAEKPLPIVTGGRCEVAFVHTFADPGSHWLEVEIVGANDALAVDDRRALAVEVQARMPILLVESRPGFSGSDGDLGLVALALDPEGEGSGLFRPVRIGAGDLAHHALEPYRAVVLGNLPALDAGGVTALERYVAAGGGVLVGLGEAVNIEWANRYWARGGDGFLPSPLRDAAAPEPAEKPAVVQSAHPALQAFAGETGEVWKGVRVERYFRLDTQPLRSGELHPLVTLGGGDPLLVVRGRGQGRVALLTTSLDLSWTNLPTQAAYVPLVRGLVAFLASEILPPRNLSPGQPLSHRRRGNGVPRAERVGGESVPLSPGAWEGQSAEVSAPLRETGGYRVVEPGLAAPIFYAVRLDPAEGELEPVDRRERGRAIRAMRPVVLDDAEALRARLDPRHRRAVELWRWFLGMAVMLLFAETFLTRRQAARERIGAVPGAAEVPS